MTDLDAAKVPYMGQVQNKWLPALLSWIVPALVFFALWSFLMKRMAGEHGLGGGMGGFMSIGKSKAKVYMETDTKVTFQDVAGIDEAKEELQEVIGFLQGPRRYGQLGGRGYTIQPLTEDRFLMTREALESKMAVLLDGRAAEHLVFGDLSTGAADDLAKVTDIARSMAMRYGIDEAFDKARRVLSENRGTLDRGAELLLQKETLNEDELRSITNRDESTPEASIVHPAQAPAA